MILLALASLFTVTLAPHAIPQDRVPVPVPVTPTAREKLVDIRVGTRLELDLPEGMSLGDIEVRGAQATSIHPMHAQRVEVRLDGAPGARPWVRFDADTPRVLWVLARDGMAAGCTSLTAAQLAGQEPVPLRLRACGTIRADVRPPAPIPDRLWKNGHGPEVAYPDPAVAWGAALVLAALDPAPGPETLSARAPIEGPGRIPWVPAGRWRVTATSPYFQTGAGIELIVNAGCVETLELVLGPPASRGEVRVRIVRVPPRDFADLEERSFGKLLVVFADLESRVPGGRFFHAASSSICGTGVDEGFELVERDGRVVLETVFHDVPAGEYTLSAHANGLLVPTTLPVRTGDGIELTFFESKLERGLGFRITPPEDFSGKLPYMRLDPVRSDVPFPLTSPTLPVTSWIAAPELSSQYGNIEWRLRVSGFEDVYGDRDSFRGPGLVRWADVQLRRAPADGR